MDNLYRQTDRQTDRQIVVIIPIFNCRNYVQCAIQSVLNQRYKNIFVVFVDDGSTDGSSAICDEIAAKNIKISSLHKENGGVSSARNLGIEYVISRQDKFEHDCYLSFLDADDLWMENTFDETCKSVLNKGYDLIGFQSCRCNETATRRSNPVTLEAGEYNGGVASIWINAGQHFGAMLYNIDFIKKYNLKFCDIKASEDKIFIMQCLYLANKIYLENKLMYLYRQTNSSAVHNRDTGIKYFKPIIDAYLKSDEEMAQWASEKRKRLNAGKLLAGIYVMDMIDDLYQNGGTRAEVDLIFNDNPSYRTFVSDDGPQLGRWKKMQNHPVLYRMQNRIYGLIFSILRRIYHVNFIKAILDRKRYPIDI